MMLFSVAILTRDRSAMLEDCLRAILAQTHPPHEVVVVDNGSTDATPEAVERMRQEGLAVRRVEGVAPGDSQGAARARNLAVREARGQWVAFIDDDCLPGPDWLERMAAHVAQGRLDAIGGVVVDAGDLRFPWWWHEEMNWAPGLSVPGMWGPEAGSVYYPQTANMAVRRDVLEAEPFQELDEEEDGGRSAFRATREDAELWRRLRRRGYRTTVDAKIVVRHRTDRARVGFRAVLRRAWQDGASLQRREPSDVLLDWAHNTLLSLPFALAFGVWTGPRAPWREVAWRIVWAVRQAGQWGQARRSKGGGRALAKFAALTIKRLAGWMIGGAKWAARTALVAAHRLRGRRTARLHRPASVVVACVGYLGDTVLLHPFLSALKAQRPEVFITLLTNRAGEQVYRHDPAVHQIVILEGGREARARDRAAIAYALDHSRAPLVLAPYFYKVDPMEFLARRGVRVVAFAEEVGFGKRLHYDLADRLVPKPAGRPEGLNLANLFHEAGLEGGIPEEIVPLAFEPDELLGERTVLRSEQLGPENMVILAPGSAKADKRWPEERWGEVARYLVDEYELQVVVTGPTSESGMCGRVARASRRPLRVWCHNDLRRLALWLAEARLLVASDNGCKHMAAAMDTATLCLYGPTDERQWGALRHKRKHVVVRACAWDLSGEERLGLSVTHQMDCISVAQVCRALDEMLSER